ncbi:MAG: ATP-dependent Clp protease ATP-binding subunit ClpC [Verrucomicrobiales bacterium]|jgi:ATP-dependent Clp protease ATP-binding subunit ClpC
MATTYRYPAFLWQNHDGLHTGRLLDDDDDATAVAPTRKGVIDQLKEYLQFVHANEDDYWVPDVEFLDPEKKVVKIHIHPEYRDKNRTYACKESIELRLPCVIGKRSTGLRCAILPTIDVEFDFNDPDSFGKLAAHYVQNALSEKSPRELSRDLPPATVELTEVVITAKTKKRRLRQEIEVPNLASIADPATSRDLRRSMRTWERESEMRSIVEILREEATNLCILGQAGSGKTSVLIEAARKIEAERASRLDSGEQRPQVFWLTSAGRLIAGMQYLGQWQERFESAIDELSRLRGILCFENLHDLFRLGGSEPESSIAAFIAPFVKNGELRIVAEATREELDACDRLLPGLVDQLQLFDLPDFDEASSQRVLHRAAEALTRDQPVNFSTTAADTVGQLFNRFQPYIAFPGKVVQFMREVATQAIESGNPDILPDSVRKQFCKSTGLPELFLDDAVPLTKSDIESSLSHDILGQTEALQTIANMLVKFKVGMNDPRRPLGVFLFTGPTGVGKTAVVRALGNLLFGEKPENERLVRLDMSEYADYDAPMRLLGNPFGQPSELIRQIRANPFTILLLDEIEKASEEVFDVFLNVFEEARLTDAFGRSTAFNSTIIIMTSNLGAKSSGALGFGDHDSADIAAARTDPAVAKQFFRPEFFNRLDRMVTFEPLRYETVIDITRKELADLARREGISSRGIELEWDKELIKHLAATGFDPKYGARPLQRKIEEIIVVPLSRFMAEHPAIGQTKLLVRIGEEAVEFSETHPG